MSQYNEIILPESTYQSVRSFQNFKKANVRLEAQGTSADITASQTVEFVLPTGHLVDISSFAVFLEGLTITGGATVKVPSFGDSFIQRVEILSGSTIQVINNYNVLMNCMRNVAEGVDHASSYASVYQGSDNATDTYNADWVNIITNWIGLLGTKKLIQISPDFGMMEMRVRLVFADNAILASSTPGAVYKIGKVYATVNTVQLSEPSLEAAIKSLNGTPEISFDYVQQYSELANSGASLNVKIPVIASSLKHIVVTARKSDYNTQAAYDSSTNRTLFPTTNYFKFESLKDLQIDTGNGMFPGAALSTSKQQAYFTAESLGIDDNWAAGAAGFRNNSEYANWSWACVFGMGMRDAPPQLLIGYNTKGAAQMLLRGVNNATATAKQVDVFTISSAVMTMKPGQYAIQI
jgi:hypothetical protein